MAGEARCERSPDPVKVGMNTSCPVARLIRATRE